MSNASILLVGIGGYGNVYTRALVNYKGERNIKIAGFIDPAAEKCTDYEKLKEMGVPRFESMEDFYQKSSADLAVISTPIHFHCSHVCTALKNGSNVLCEKPVSATIQEVNKMIEARDKYGKFVAIGYQWSHSEAIQSLKKDIIAGLFGRPVRLKSITLWPRDAVYYSRGWAGKRKAADGSWILDSVANNATAHFLHNMFYVLGSSIDKSACPGNVTAELYRANNIENFDTSMIRAVTTEGAEILFYATHAVIENLGPAFDYEFENAVVKYRYAGKNTEDDKSCNNIVAYFKDGSIKEYGNPEKETIRKLWMAIDSVCEGKPVVCGLEAASSQVLCINGAHESMPEIVDFPKEIIKVETNKNITYVDGLNEIIKECYKDAVLPYEKGTAWAKQGKKVNMEGYSCFNG